MDDSARDIEAELKQIPQNLEELRNGVQTLERLLSQERQQLAEAEGLKARQGEELKERGEGLQRARKKVAQSSNVREAEAAEREVDANRRAIKEREEELGRIAQAIEAKRVSLAEREKDFEEARGLLQSQEVSARARVTALEEQRGTLLHGRDEIVAKVSGAVIKRYERLKAGLSNAVIIVGDGTCSACRMALPAQLTIELRRASELHQCPHCRRILIHKSVLED
jgi:predicted  nucleic acid-binding Zn-ribbon protein